MAALLKERDAAERERLIVSIADDAASRLDPSMLAGGKLTFPQESFVVTLHSADASGKKRRPLQQTAAGRRSLCPS